MTSVRKSIAYGRAKAETLTNGLLQRLNADVRRLGGGRWDPQQVECPLGRPSSLGSN